MFDGPFIVTIALAYVSVLFAIAWFGDLRSRRLVYNKAPAASRFASPIIYTLSLAVYCTSWSFFGNVGLSARTGFDFIPVYLGPILMFTIGLPLVLHVIRLSKKHNITSVADFLSARYGKSQSVAAVVTIFLVLSILPYIALQLKAIAVSVDILLGSGPKVSIMLPRLTFDGTSFVITLALAIFAILFGTRHADATEHQQGLTLAIATGSVVKLMAFSSVGLFVIFSIFSGFDHFSERASQNFTISRIFGQGIQGIDGGQWLVIMLLSSSSVLLLPRLFHVGVVENKSERDVHRAAWLFPIYLILTTLFVAPIAMAGIMTLPPGSVDPDFFVLALPIWADSEVMSLVAFIGGLSAAAAMVIVESIALAIMVCNGLVMPFLLRQKVLDVVPRRDMAVQLLTIRRVAIVVIMLMSYLVFRGIGTNQNLAALGLISLAAIAQIGPAFFGGLLWRGATAHGVIAGIATGFCFWVYTLLLPWAAESGWVTSEFIEQGPWGLSLLRPEALLYFDIQPLTHGVFWSLATNILAFVGVSMLWPANEVDRLHAHAFLEPKENESEFAKTPSSLDPIRTPVKVSELLAAVERYLGSERAERAFIDYARSRQLLFDPNSNADVGLFRLAENLLASSIGPASARLVLALLLKRDQFPRGSARQLLDDASEALQYNRDLLQLAIDQVRHGLCVFDKDMRLVCWNRQFRILLDLPSTIVQVGLPLDRMLRVFSERGDYGPGDINNMVTQRLKKLAVTKETFQEHINTNGRNRVLEIRTSPMPQGGFVTTFSDITDRIEAANMLARTNEDLERRVHERTAELMDVNRALEEANAKAIAANVDKTRFLAAASHDILQPLNAARLYATTLSERSLPKEGKELAQNVDSSLAAVEEIFAALIDISRLDTGRLKPEYVNISLEKLFDQLQLEFGPLAQEKGLELRVFETDLWVRSDKRMLRRVLQNLISNAIKYTREGAVLLGIRRRGDNVLIQVIDTGPGIPSDKKSVIFEEFQRLEGAGSQITGLGLGLSIVKRISRTLGAPINLTTSPGKGSMFAVEVPVGEPVSVTDVVEEKPMLPGCLAGRTVLCIDNEPDVRNSMKALLEGWNCEVILADSVTNSVDVVRRAKNSPEIILADYHLDLGTGVEAINAVNAELDNSLPAIVITADHTPEVHEDIASNGFGLLQKPVKAAALRALMAHNLTRISVAVAE